MAFPLFNDKQKFMKILHTSDWHLGKRLADINRNDVSLAFLNWLTREICERKVDALVIAGDIFDSAVPTNESQKQYYEFLNGLVNTPCKAVVVIAGNHDSPYFLTAAKELLQRLSFYVVGVISEDPSKQVKELLDQDGNVGAIVGMVPYIREGDVYRSAKGDSATDRDAKVIEAIREHYKNVFEQALKVRSERNIPIILTGHLFCAGTTLFDDKEIDKYVLGNLGLIPMDVFPAQAAYVALGHIHKPQILHGDKTRNYCGSPYAMEFVDGHMKKYVRLVEFQGAKPTVTDIEVPIFSRLEQIKGTEEQLIAKLNEFISEDEEILCEAIHEGEEFKHGLIAALNEVVKGTKVKLPRIKDTERSKTYLSSMTNEEFVQEMNPQSVFEKRLEAAATLTDEEKEELRVLYQSVVDEINNGEENLESAHEN